MTEDLTPDVLAYLLDEMDPPRRAAFEASMAGDPSLRALVKSVADALAADALGGTPAAPLSSLERHQSAVRLVAAVDGAPQPAKPALGRLLWPLAAAVLLALNLAQWIVHSRPRPLTVDLVGATAAAAPRHPGVIPAGLLTGMPAAPASALPGGTTMVSMSQTLTVTQTYAWSAFDREKHEGVLDLHNLPSVPGDRTLELWVLPTATGRFESVGQIPAQFYGRSGNITYRLRGELVPAQIMITVERRTPRATMPSGPVVLRGP